MKHIGLIIISVITAIACVIAYIALPEGKVVEYRLDQYSSRYGSGTYCIQVVVENGLDNYIDCNAYSLQQIQQMCDSLNKKIKK